MKKIEFEATFGNKQSHVEVVFQSGIGEACQVIIDKGYQGQIICYKGQWQPYLNSNTILTGDDVMALIEIIEKHQELNQ